MPRPLIRLTQNGRQPQSTPIDFTIAGNTIIPERFALPGPDGERLDVRFAKDRVEVRHRVAKGKVRVFGERVVVSLAWMARQLPALLGLDR